jgi:hypothetical protein
MSQRNVDDDAELDRMWSKLNKMSSKLKKYEKVVKAAKDLVYEQLHGDESTVAAAEWALKAAVEPLSGNDWDRRYNSSEKKG